MFKEAPAPTAEMLAKIEELEASAKRQMEAKEESFERCDTDGFLSQWASGIGAERDRREIQILKQGGCATFPVLCDSEGNVIATKIYTFPDQYRGHGFVDRWKIDEAKYGKKWIPTGEKSRVQKQLGLHEEYRWFPAYAKIAVPRGAKSTGLGGCANAYVGTFKKDEG